MQTHVIELIMDPVAKGRPKFRRGGVAYTPAKTALAERDVKTCLLGLRMPKIFGPVSVSIEFYLHRPKNCRRTFPTVRPDLDNLAKLYLDAGNAILWHDDKDIIDLHISKRYGVEPKIVIRYYQIADLTRPDPNQAIR